VVSKRISEVYSNDVSGDLAREMRERRALRDQSEERSWRVCRGSASTTAATQIGSSEGETFVKSKDRVPGSATAREWGLARWGPRYLRRSASQVIRTSEESA
jgi:hypothetical protein